MLNKLLLVFRTIRHLRPAQLYYQVYYRIRSKFISYQSLGSTNGFDGRRPLKMVQFSFVSKSTQIQQDDENVTFTFLNLSVLFNQDSIDWNCPLNGKLWTYNLNYFDFLFCENLDRETGLKLISDYCSQFDQIKDGLEPYPISLRGINWIKFLSAHKIEDEKINLSLYRQYQILASSLEYHLMANHLLENGFSLLFAAYYFQNQNYYEKAKRILDTELEEQLFDDGGHFERSPMYHQIILFRLLDCLNLVQRNDWMQQELLSVIKGKSSLMLSWLKKVTMKNGEIPYVKDSAYNIAPSTNHIMTYAEELGIETQDITLYDSGYRKYSNGKTEILIDIGETYPNYQPGHAHADELNFVIHHNETPFIVDTGVSTYQIGERRSLERSTYAHNCIVINDSNSSEVWGGFRVGRRAKVQIESEQLGSISAIHNGYKHQNIIINRNFAITPRGVEIIDSLVHSAGNKVTAQMNLHFHPDLKIEKISDNTFSIGDLRLILDGVENATIKSYKFAAGFNQLKEGPKLNWTFLSKSKIQIYAN